MSDNSYQVFLNSVLTLAQTLIVKSEYVAQRTNERLLQFLEYETDLDAPETWKYYMNLAGEYHPTDKVMVVTSSDNLDLIEFNKTNLIRHRNTARDYQFGTRQYGELLERYPGQEDVILGILYPVDKATAIAAPDHKILGYPKALIESNEYTLVEELQKWTNVFFKRYYNEQYTISDSLYMGVVLTMYHMNMVPAIMTFRLKKHKTIEAHSYWVQQYLASNSGLGKYHPFMTLSQAMHFYRNIRYYQRHAGMNQTLEQLADALMTARYLPLADYTMRHDTTNQTDNVYADVLFRRKDMTRIPSAGAPEYIDTETLLNKEIPEAPGNDEEIAYSTPQIKQFLKDSPSNAVLTKVLESAAVDYSGALTYKLEDVQVAHWLWYAKQGLYSAVVNVSNPKTSERIVLTVKDAYVLATYCLYKSYDISPDLIPLLGAQRVQRYPLPDEADIKSVADMRYIDDFTYGAAWSLMEEVEDMISIDAFYDKTVKIHRAANYQRNLSSFQEGMNARGETLKLTGRFWADAYVRLEDADLSYAEWLFSRNLNFDNLSRAEFELLYTAIVAAAIGKSLTTAPSLRNVQKAMASALKDLSSYTIQVVTMMADSETIMTDFPSVRVGEQEVSGSNKERLRVGDHDVFSEKVSGVNKDELNVNIFTEILSHEVTASGKDYLNLYNGPHLPDRGMVYKHKHPLGRANFGLVTKPDVTGTNLQPVMGMASFMALTDEQKATFFEL